jgi:trehalose 6-phosphate phosphatase
MRYLFSAAGMQALDSAAARGALVALDFDGTLAPIVSEPTRAAMRRSTRGLLRDLARVLPCAVISGRSRADLRRRLGALRVAEVIGNHGIEPSRAAARAARDVRHWHPLLVRELAGIAGVAIENKRLSLAVHYRKARRKALVRSRVCRLAAALGGVRLIPGKQVVNLLPLAAPHKGTALARTRRRLGCRAVIFVGDDATDEDAFRLVESCPLLGVRVGYHAASAAQYYLSSQREIDAMLRRLIRAAQAGRGGV